MAPDAVSGRPVADRIAAGAAVSLALLLLLRVLRYLTTTLPEPLDAALGEALVFAWLLFVFPLLFAVPHLAALLLLLVAAVVRPALVLRREQGRQRLRPWFHAFLWCELALNHYLLDLNPHLALGLAGALLAVEWRSRFDGGRAGAVAVVGAIAAWALVADTLPSRLAGLLFAALLALALADRRVLGLRERRLAVVAAGVGCQVLAAVLPLLVPLHGGTLLGRGLAYSFCESPAAGRLYAAVPEAPTMLPWSFGPHGRGGFVASHRLPDLALEERLRLFSDDFHGRLEWLTCLPDRVFVGMTNTTWQGETRQDHALSFAVADPSDVDRDAAADGVGHGIVHDPKRGALYFVSENRPDVVRLDLASGEREAVLPELARHRRFPSFTVGPRSFHAGRDSFFLSEWFGGRQTHEVHLASERRRGSYDHRNGGALGTTVDEAWGRLFVVGLWGMEVFDIASGEVIERVRLGTLPRSPAIDEERGLVYVASTATGEIRVFDRASLAPLGAIAVGYGARIPHFSTAADRLLAGSAFAYYAWDGGALAERFGVAP